jgi:hypothetical protein
MAFFVVWPHPALRQPVVAGPFMTFAQARDASRRVVRGTPDTWVLEAATLEQARERAQTRLGHRARRVDGSTGEGVA